MANHNDDYYNASVYLSSLVRTETSNKKVRFVDDMNEDDNYINENIHYPIVPRTSSTPLPAVISSSNHGNSVSSSFSRDEPTDKQAYSYSSLLRDESAFKSGSSAHSSDLIRISKYLMDLIRQETQRLFEDEKRVIPALNDINDAVRRVKKHREDIILACEEYISEHLSSVSSSAVIANAANSGDAVTSSSVIANAGNASFCTSSGPSHSRSYSFPFSSSSSSAAAAAAAATANTTNVGVSSSSTSSVLPNRNSFFSSSSSSVAPNLAYDTDAVKLDTIRNEEQLASLKQKFYDARFGQLSVDESDKINRILQGPTSTDEVLIEKFNIPMTSAKLSCLRPGTWLNDEVINFCMLMLEERDIKLSEIYPSRKKSHYFNSFFMEKLLGQGHKKYAYDDVKRWSRKFDIFELDKIFIPINISQSHWSLAVILIQKKEILYVDSMNGQGKGTKYVKALLRWLVDEARTRKNTALNTSEWKLTSISCPQQRNGFDCGVYTVMATNFFSDNLPIEEAYYGQNDMPFFRVKMASDILRGYYDYPID